MSRAAWYRAIEARVIEELAPGVARLWGAPASKAQRILAAVWAAGPGAVASHRSSAWLWGVDRPSSDPIDVSMHSRTTKFAPRGVVAHRPRDLLDLRPIPRDGIPTTSPVRMLLDLGAVDPGRVPAALDTIISAKVVRPAAIRAGLDRHSRQGRHGVVALRAALDARSIDEVPADSLLEVRMAELITRFQLPPTEFHPIVEGFEIDFRVLGSIVLIECDGHEAHGLDRGQFEFDRIRDATLTAAGYVIVHVTWVEVTRRPTAVAKRLQAVLRKWAPEVLANWTAA